MNIKDKVILITGSADRVGKILALGFAKKKAKILLHYYSSKEKANKTYKQVTSLGAPCYLFQADLTKENEMDTLISNILKKVGKLDVIINSASIFENKAFENISFEDFDRVMNLGIKAPFFLIQKAMALNPKMILNIADHSALKPWISHLPHSLAKASLVHLTKGLAKTLSPIRVNGLILGPLLKNSNLTDREWKNYIEKASFLKRPCKEEEFLAACFHLIENEYLNAEILKLDGGSL